MLAVWVTVVNVILAFSQQVVVFQLVNLLTSVLEFQIPVVKEAVLKVK
jgi:hypothetical protein